MNIKKWYKIKDLIQI